MHKVVSTTFTDLLALLNQGLMLKFLLQGTPWFLTLEHNDHESSEAQDNHIHLLSGHCLVQRVTTQLNQNGPAVKHVKIEFITRSPEHGVCYTAKTMIRQNYCEIHTRQLNNKATMTSVF